jgi:hypothetical protein
MPNGGAAKTLSVRAATTSALGLGNTPDERGWTITPRRGTSWALTGSSTPWAPSVQEDFDVMDRIYYVAYPDSETLLDYGLVEQESFDYH